MRRLVAASQSQRENLNAAIHQLLVPEIEVLRRIPHARLRAVCVFEEGHVASDIHPLAACRHFSEDATVGHAP